MEKTQGRSVVVPALREDGCMGLGLPRTFIRWLRFCKKRNKYGFYTNNLEAETGLPPLPPPSPSRSVPPPGRRSGPPRGCR